MKCGNVGKKLLIFLIGCSVNKNNTDNNETNNSNENQSDKYETTYQEFVDQFSDNCPDFELLDVQKGSNENDPILCAGVAENKTDNTSSTLFIVDDSGIGQVTLADGLNGIYREEDGLVLDGNVISISLEIINSDQSEEIHDYKITVTREYDQGVPNILYKNDETIRKE